MANSCQWLQAHACVCVCCVCCLCACVCVCVSVRAVHAVDVSASVSVAAAKNIIAHTFRGQRSSIRKWLNTLTRVSACARKVMEIEIHRVRGGEENTALPACAMYNH